MNFTDFKYKANYYVLLLVAFVIPLDRRLIAPTLILFFVTSLINSNFKNKSKLPILIFISLFILYLIGLLYTSDLKVGYADVGSKLALILLPLSFFISKINIKEVLPKILISFIEGCLVSVVIALISSGIHYYYNFDFTQFFYGGAALFMHPSYLAMFLTLCLIILYSFLFSKTERLKTTIIFCLLFIFSGYILLLSSKTGIITMLLVHFLSILIWVLKYKTYLKGGIVLLALIGSFLLVYNTSDLFRNRMNEITTVRQSNPTEISSTSSRKQIWKTAIKLIKKNAIVGYGTGDAKNVLLSEFKEQQLDYFYEKKLNAHNQFLQTSLAIGLIGGLTLLFLIIYSGYLAIKQKHYIYFGFLILIVINFLTEAMLERQVGVMFYAFFNTLFFSVIINKSND